MIIGSGSVGKKDVSPGGEMETQQGTEVVIPGHGSKELRITTLK